jgi:chemotaxis protein MotB
MCADALLILSMRYNLRIAHVPLLRLAFRFGSACPRSLLPLALLGCFAFIGLSCSASEEVEALRKENKQLRQKLERARGEAASPQRGQTIQVLSTDVYFKSGSAELSPEGVDELKAVAERIQSEFPDRTIRIEGYTDTQPIAAPLEDKYPSNWELSAARAARVARHFRWTHDMDPSRFEVVGFGAQHPVATNETAEGRGKNRRVRVAVLRRSPTPDAE